MTITCASVDYHSVKNTTVKKGSAMLSVHTTSSSVCICMHANTGCNDMLCFPLRITDVHSTHWLHLHGIHCDFCYPQDRMTAELFRYRNKDGCLIILYDDEERAAVHAAQTLLHRVSVIRMRCP
jgi:hypothetical protein